MEIELPLEIEWNKRYSSTDEPDNYGRWARVAYTSGYQIAWISYLHNVNTKPSYMVHYYFPCKISGGYTPNFFDLEDAKEHVEKKFTDFIIDIFGR